ncbi:hypothetical protein J6590_086535 [Homalodisca vitripennis]|nr:hypothetical protein J6590_086535 [Homalodisca vitripennis]
MLLSPIQTPKRDCETRKPQTRPNCRCSRDNPYNDATSTTLVSLDHNLIPETIMEGFPVWLLVPCSKDLLSLQSFYRIVITVGIKSHTTGENIWEDFLYGFSPLSYCKHSIKSHTTGENIWEDFLYGFSCPAARISWPTDKSHTTGTTREDFLMAFCPGRISGPQQETIMEGFPVWLLVPCSKDLLSLQSFYRIVITVGIKSHTTGENIWEDFLYGFSCPAARIS